MGGVESGRQRGREGIWRDGGGLAAEDERGGGTWRREHFEFVSFFVLEEGVEEREGWRERDGDG